MRGKWAQGIVPRSFFWIIKDQMAICERPGGYGTNHRRVRRQEEIIWIRENDFDVVVSLLASEHNLHNYEELVVPWVHEPYGEAQEGPRRLVQVIERTHNSYFRRRQNYCPPRRIKRRGLWTDGSVFAI